MQRAVNEKRTVAALYIDAAGPYSAMLGVECWDRTRDARKYTGPHPIIAHPPCGPWGRLWRHCRHQDPTLAPLAVQQVQRYGGVLEHPVDSRLWRHCQLPRPGEFSDLCGGWTMVVDQVAWGHPARKRTWLYVVGLPRTVMHEIRSEGTVRKLVTNMPRGRRHITPPDFANWLVSLARRSMRQSGA